MGAIGVLLVAHCVVSYLFQMVALSSEKFKVTGSTRPVLAPLGGKLELSCQLSPPQNAQHMEIRWFRNRYTQPVHLYKNGKIMYGEIISKYVERTELIKDDIGEGKVTLRIFNVTVDDDGTYHCFFKDGELYEEHITEVKVTATGSNIQILMHLPNIKGVMLECHSGGWFPLPHMEWKDSRGQVIPATSKSYSQNGSKLFNMTMALFIETSSHQNVTCYLQNSLTHQEESISIILSGELFSWKSLWAQVLSMIALVLAAFLVTSFVQKCFIHGSVSGRFCYWLKSIMVVTAPVIAIMGTTLILHLKQRVAISDPHFELDTLWLEDTTVFLFVLIVFTIKFISLPYFRFDGCVPESKACSCLFSTSVIVLQVLCCLVSNLIIIQYQQFAKDVLYSLFERWESNLDMVIYLLTTVFSITIIILSWTHMKNLFQAFGVFIKLQMISNTTSWNHEEKEEEEL